MITQTKIIYALISICFIIELVSSDEIVLTVDESHCVEYRGGYGRRSGLGIVCCGNQTLYLPIELVDNWETNPHLDSCTLEYPTYHEEDMSTALWKVNYCVFQNASAFPDSKITFENFFKFVTQNYPKDIKDSIKTATDSCKKDAEKASDNVRKIQKFTECLHKGEKQICDKPYATSFQIEQTKKLDHKYDCPGLEGVYGTDRVEFCCKKESIPYNFLEFYIHYPKPLDLDKIDNCTQSFVNRQVELDPTLKKELESLDSEDLNGNMTEAETTYQNAAALLEHCQMACELRQKYYVDSKELTINFEGVLAEMIHEYGKKQQDDLKKIVIGRKPTFKYYKGNSTLSLDKLMNQFKVGDEMTRIRIYCNFYLNIAAEVERALHEHCFDKDFADKWLGLHLEEIVG